MTAGYFPNQVDYGYQASVIPFGQQSPYISLSFPQPTEQYEPRTENMAGGTNSTFAWDTFRWVVGGLIALASGACLFILNNISNDINTLKSDIKTTTASIAEAKLDFTNQLRSIDKNISSIDLKTSVTNQRLEDIAKSIKPPR